MGIGPDDEPWGAFIALLMSGFGVVLALTVFPVKFHMIMEVVGIYVFQAISYITQPPIGEYLVITALVIFSILLVYAVMMVVNAQIGLLRHRPIFSAIIWGTYGGVILIEYLHPNFIPLTMVEVVLAPVWIAVIGIVLFYILSVAGFLYFLYEKIVWVKHRLMN